MKLPENVQYIISKLEKAGFEGYAVGGCVRDTMLGKTPDDWDITTSASPKQVKNLFSRTVDTGILHGTITVLVNKTGYEVTTYRIDGEYEDNRHPKEVIFTSSLLEDLKRRDFTINAMAYNEKTGIVDEFGGMEDLGQEIIRCVGSPKERFCEDALRIMRAVRFSAQLGYRIEENTKKAIEELYPNLSSISVERINTELTKLLISANPDYLRNAYEMGITRVILPEFDDIMMTQQNNPHHCFSVGEHTLHALKQVPADKILRYAVLFHDFGKAHTKSTDEEGIDHFYGHADISAELTRVIMRRLRFDNDTLYSVEKLVRYHDFSIDTTKESVRRAMAKVGEELFPKLLQVREADLMAQSEYKRKDKEEKASQIQILYSQILQNKECVSLKSLAVNGNDLINNGVKPGKEIGNILANLLDIVLSDPEKNTKEYLISRIGK